MVRSFQRLVIIAPLVVSVAYAQENAAAVAANPFGFDPAQLAPIQFTRSRSERAPVAGTSGSSPGTRYTRIDRPVSSRQTEFSFKLKPKRPDFSRDGIFGLDLFTQPELDIQSRLLGPTRLNKDIPEINEGFEYSAGVRVEHEDADIDGTAYVSSALLGLSYGRLGRLWYGGIDVNLEQFTDSYYGVDQPDVLSLDVTTGRRFGFTGLSETSPLWLLSVQGNFDMDEPTSGSDLYSHGAWFLNPSLFWQQPGFTFSAQMQLPVEYQETDDNSEPDYRLRAVFEKQFK